MAYQWILVSFVTSLILVSCNQSTENSIPATESAIIATVTETEYGDDSTDAMHDELVLMPDSFYLAHPSIPDSAKLLYTKKIRPFDDTYTFCVFDSLETANDTLLPFYFYTTLIISEQSDGALSEMVGLTIHSFALHHPNKLQKLLALPDVIKGETNRDIWLHWTLSENDIVSEDHELEGIEHFGEQMLSNSNDSTTVAFTKQYVRDLKKLLPKWK